MTNCVYLAHCGLVFLVPFLFGWVALRRIFRESSLVALLPGAVIVGLASLMALVNELRFFCGMGLSVWVAYKVLLVLALILHFAVPTRSVSVGFPLCVARPSRLILLAAATLGVALFFGIPALSGYLNDAWWYHYPAAVQIQNTERFPLYHVFAVDTPLYYHYGPDILSAIWSFELNISVQTACALNVLILAPSAFLLGFALVCRISHNFWSSFFGASFLIAGGNLRFLFFLTGKFTGTLGVLRVCDSQTVQGLLQMVFTPSNALGIPLVLLILLCFRHFSARPTWPLAVSVGLLMGMLTLVSEWLFLPLVLGVTVIMVAKVGLRNTSQRRLVSARYTIAILPAAIALVWACFNGSYFSGIFSNYWMHFQDIDAAFEGRQIAAQMDMPYEPIVARKEAPAVVSKGEPSSFNPRRVTIELADRSGAERMAPIAFPSVAGVIEVQRVGAKPAPDLFPLHLNVTNFGHVPSWEAAASNESGSISILGGVFLAEAMPVLLIGIPIGIWLAVRSRKPVIFLLAWLALSAAIPPIFLDWGYRASDLLRFFTASYSYAALFLGCAVGHLLTRPSLRARVLGGLLSASCLINPICLGVVGLLPGTIAKVTGIASSAQSLSNVAANDQHKPNPAPMTEFPTPEADRQKAFKVLSIETGDFLFPISHGRDRAIVVVPSNQVPEVKYFQDWMKMATLSRIVLPVGWHWTDSLYSTYYREAVLRLDANAISALGAKWVIVSNVFMNSVPIEVGHALADRARFVPVNVINEGPYYMAVFKVRSFRSNSN